MPGGGTFIWTVPILHFDKASLLRFFFITPIDLKGESHTYKQHPSSAWIWQSEVSLSGWKEVKVGFAEGGDPIYQKLMAYPVELLSYYILTISLPGVDKISKCFCNSNRFERRKPYTWAATSSLEQLGGDPLGEPGVILQKGKGPQVATQPIRHLWHTLWILLS